MSQASVSLEVLHGMVRKVLDSQKMLREDTSTIRRRLSRLELALLGLQRTEVDRLDAETSTQDQLDESWLDGSSG